MTTAADGMYRGRLWFSDETEIDGFVETLGRFERGEIDADTWRRFRLLYGTYKLEIGPEQYFLRVKIPQGILAAAQLEVLAEVASRHSRGFLHVTTRQNVQLHCVAQDELEPALRTLAAAGLTTREACGDSVRNVTASAVSGVAADEAFDPSPYAAAFSRHFLRHPLSSGLPRKFKVAFDGGGRDHSFVLVNDLGFRARLLPDGRRGFRVTVGGGTSISCQSAELLDEALPAGELFALSEAVLRVYHRQGDRLRRKKSRMKFFVRALGIDTLRKLVLAERAAVAAAAEPALPFPADDPPAEDAPPPPRLDRPSRAELLALVGEDPLRGPGLIPRHLPLAAGALERFLRTNAAPQKQPGFAVVTVALPLGDVSAGRLRALAALSRCYADGTVRLTHEQNLLLRWVPSDRLRELAEDLDAVGLGRTDPGSIADVTSCPGAETCSLAVTESRQVARAVNEHVERTPSLRDRAAGLTVKVSGCPNGCGLHHVAGIGLQGSLRKVGETAEPHYILYLGGEAAGDEARFGRIVGRVPAPRVPEALERLVVLFEKASHPEESATAFFGRIPLGEALRALGGLVDSAEEQPPEAPQLEPPPGAPPVQPY